MGQKVSPVGLRIGINKDWESKWYAGNKDFAKYLNNDVQIRRFLEKKLKDAAISSILIERNAEKTNVIINTAKRRILLRSSAESAGANRLSAEQGKGARGKWTQLQLHKAG